jgi:hypothetical protein
MAESKMFALLNGITVEKIVASVEGFVRTEKSMDVQSAATTDGYVIQASQPKDGWKSISGTRLAITVQLIKVGDHLNVMIGQGQWADKIGAGALGWFVAWPLAVTAGIGAFKQKKLEKELFDVIERTILFGGQSAVVQNAGVRIAEGAVVCPKCKAQCPAGSKFCNVCGEKILSECPGCGASLVPGSAFCNQCGQKIG